ncbi:hypothetical protein JG688_00002539 [Phytophthora aleatoria]|uniref:Uncharacterized protein n=1 Tax=Phytophthora aleatoria TaxID=2496075 RepID=A0A8J5M8N4_9STRA|nr:hypothetical protein JG688_00002539 [Phytophthora aleatoria]
MVKAASKEGLEDRDPLQEEHPYTRAILANNGYQEFGYTHRAIIPTRHCPSTPLTPQQTTENAAISSDRVVIEIVFRGTLHALGNLRRQISLARV